MNIQTIHGKHQFNLANDINKRLTPGQIVQGNILKLYPNNKAQIILNTSQTLIAQLEASLNVGGKYHFQVQANNDVLHLKVVGEPLTGQMKQNASNLLKHLGLKNSKLNIDFVQLLMNEKIPFDKNQLNKGLQFLSQNEYKQESLQAVKQMIMLKTPMKEDIFNAFYNRNTNQLSHLMKELSQMLKNDSNSKPVHQNLQNILEKMLDSSVNHSLHITEGKTNRPLKEMPLNQSIRSIQQLIQNSDDFLRIKQEINSRIIPNLPSNLQQLVLAKLDTSQANPRELLSLLETIKNEMQTSQNTVLNTHSRSNSLQVLREQFTLLLNDYLQFIGTTDENRLKETQQPALSLKALLLQTIQQESDSQLQQRAQTLVHVLNGLQLQSINENQHFIQASLQLPGEKFSLNEDIFIEFDSKKTADGKVDPEHARVLFYLNLGNIKETVIDMQIQKRHVTIALYNDHRHIKEKAMVLKPLLEKRLKSLNYHLTSVSVKPLKDTNQTNHQILRSQPLYSKEGIDFKV